jgi:hypothetical protein
MVEVKTQPKFRFNQKSRPFAKTLRHFPIGLIEPYRASDLAEQKNTLDPYQMALRSWIDSLRVDVSPIQRTQT